LVIVLAVTTVAAVAAAELSWRVMVSRAVVANREAALANRAGALSATAVARALLVSDKGRNSYESNSDIWAGVKDISVGDTRVVFKIDDERGKFPLGICSDDPQFRRAPKVLMELLDSLEIDEKSLRAIVRKLSKRKKLKDAQRDFIGFFSPQVEAYEALATLAGANNGELRRRISIWTDNRFNPNTGSLENLGAFLGVFGLAEDAPTIYDAAQSEPYKTLTPLKTELSADATNVGKHMALSSNIFSVTATAFSGQIEQSFFYILKRKGERAEIIYWRRIPFVDFEVEDAESSGNSD